MAERTALNRVVVGSIPTVGIYIPIWSSGQDNPLSPDWPGFDSRYRNYPPVAQLVEHGTVVVIILCFITQYAVFPGSLVRFRSGGFLCHNSSVGRASD